MAFDLEVLPSSTGQGVWFGGQAQGEIVYQSDEEAFVLSVGLNNAGVAVWDEAFSSPQGLYTYDSKTDTAGFLTNLPLGASSWGSPSINDLGQVGYRAGFSGSGQTWVSYDGTSTVPIHAAEAGVVVGSPYSFLFTPAFNDARQIAGKVRLGAAGEIAESRPDQIRIFEPNGSSVLIAEDVDSNAASPYARFDNSVALTNDGRVVFLATLVAGGRGVFLSDGVTTVTIAVESGPDLSELEFFAPAVNETGLVAFRAFDESGLRAVFVGDGTMLRARGPRARPPAHRPRHGARRPERFEPGLRRRSGDQRSGRRLLRRHPHPACRQPDRVGHRRLRGLRHALIDLRGQLRDRRPLRLEPRGGRNLSRDSRASVTGSTAQ